MRRTGLVISRSFGLPTFINNLSMFIFCLKEPVVRAYWAASIPLIPDFISRRVERRKMTVEEAFSASLAIQKSWVESLSATDEGGAISLRFVSFLSDHGWCVRPGFVGRIEGGDENEARARALNHWHSFRGCFPDADYSIVAARNLKDFTNIFWPFYPNDLAEVRRGESIASLVEAYLPSPFSDSSKSDMQALCRSLLAAESPQLVAVTITPGALNNDERALMATEARRLGELKQRSVHTSVQSIGYGVTVQKLLAEAEQVEASYRELPTVLSQAFEMTVVLGAEKNISGGVMSCLTAEAARQDGVKEAKHAGNSPRAVFARPTSLGERLAVFKNLLEVRTDHWGSQLAPPGLHRLSKLFSPAQVHTLFRLPIPDEDGVYGIPCSAFGNSAAGGRRKQLRSSSSGASLPNTEISFGSVSIPRDRFTQHVFVAGVPGTGKTNTCLFLLERLWNAVPESRMPFMVLEPAKFEYRGLTKTPGVASDLLVFTAGDERVAPLRFNPFAVPSGISLETHVGRLIDIFRASMSMWGPLPAILEKLIRRLYRQKGWQYVAMNVDCEPPQMIELLQSIKPGIRELGYSGETESEATAALEIRIGRLCEGSLGKMLNTKMSVDFDDLMKRPVVIEIASIGNTDDRAFMLALLLNRLYEYWIARKDESGNGLKHVTLIEEAHNLLANVTTAQAEGQANPKGEAIQQFANMLAELRSFGEGFIIADQSPSKLIPDAVRMTGTKLAHAVVADEDRQVLKSSMNLTDEQAYQLALLGVGQAVVFQVGGDAATEVAIPVFKDLANFGKNINDQEVRKFSEAFRSNAAEVFLPTPGCVNCPAQCRYDELTDAAFAVLGREGERSLVGALRSWWLDVIAEKPATPPYPIFKRALQRVQRQDFDATAQQDRAFCAMTKLSYGHLQEIGKAQFIPPKLRDELHQAVSMAFLTADNFSPELASTARQFAAPIDGFAPFDGCEHCRVPCLLRGPALNLIDQDTPGYNGTHASAVTIADLAWSLTGGPKRAPLTASLEMDLAYCVAIQLCEAQHSPVDRSLLFHSINKGRAKFPGCKLCPTRCRYGERVEATVNEVLLSDEQSLAEVWQTRFGQSQADTVSSLAKVFHRFAEQVEGYEAASPPEKKVMAYCVSLHAHSRSPVLRNAGFKAPDPDVWWADVMADGCGINNL